MSNIFKVIKSYNLAAFEESTETVGSADTTLLAADANGTGPGATLTAVSPERVLRMRIAASSPIFPFDTGQHEAAEQYRIIRTKLLHHPKKPRLIVVSSATSGDGKTVTTINIAASLAIKQSSEILLVDGDLRRPRIAEMLGIPSAPGLSEVLEGAADLESALVRTEDFPNLFILPAGTGHVGAAELLDSTNWLGFIAQIRSRFSNVLFDAPPIALVADYELIQSACDGTIVVARPDHSNRSACLKALEIVPRDKLLGVVLNCFENWWLWKSDGYSYYQP